MRENGTKSAAEISSSPELTAAISSSTFSSQKPEHLRSKTLASKTLKFSRPEGGLRPTSTSGILGAVHAASSAPNFMSPEPLPWDRKEFSRERKHEITSAGAGDSTPRCRGPYQPSLHPSPSYHQLYEEPNNRYGGRMPFGRSPYSDLAPHVTSQRSLAVPVHSPPPLSEQRSLGSIGWKPMKWARARSETEVGSEVPTPNSGKEAAVRSPGRAEDGLVKKKPRLGWGQGLAKYEKQKVGGSVNSGTSSKVTGMSGSTSPVTPCSTACSSSPAGMERPFCRAANMVNDTLNVSDSPAFDSKSCPEEPSVNVDQLPPVSTPTSLVTDLLQSECACSGDSSFIINADMNKLLLFKADIAKELEKTECEIDLFDHELKSLEADQGSVPCHSAEKVQEDNDPISCKVYAESSWKILPNFAPGLSAMRDCDKPLQHEHNLQVKNADDSMGESGSLEEEMPCIVTMNSSGCTVNSENILQGQHSMNNNVVERMSRANNCREEHTLDASSSGPSYMADGSLHGRDNDDFIASVMASNKDAAKEASEVFDKALSIIPQNFDPWGSDLISSCRKNDTHIKEKLSLNKRKLKYKERVLTLKFRAFHHLWKEDLRLLSVRKQRPRSQKQFEQHNRPSQSGTQKHRSSIRSRSTLPAGNLTLVPTADIVKFASKLSDSQSKRFRRNLKMPAVILDEKERRCSMFITKNGLVEDPPLYEEERTMINLWTQEEKGAFMEMLGKFGKDFAKISSFLSHKTTADCIEFYYKNHKSESFRDVKKQLDSRKQSRCLAANTYLVTTGKKRNHVANAASLEMLGKVSVIAAHENGQSRNWQKHGRPYDSFEIVSSVEAFNKEMTAADVLAGLCGTLSSEAVSSCVTGSVSPSEKMNCAVLDGPLTPGVTQCIEEEDTCSDEDCGESVDWTDEEKSTFISALRIYGKDFERISHRVATKTRNQCKNFFSKARKCLGLDLIQPVTDNEAKPVSNANGGKSDMDDASCSKMDVDFTQCVVMNTSCEGFVHAENSFLQTEADREEPESKADVPKSISSDEACSTEGANVQEANTQEEIDDNSLNFSEDRESIRVGKDAICSPVELTTACTETEQLNPQLSVVIQPKDTTMGRSADYVKCVADSVKFPFAKESGADAAGSASNAVSKMSRCPNPNFEFLTRHQQFKPSDSISCLKKNPQLMSSPSSIYSEGSIRVTSPATINFEGHPNKLPPATINFEGHPNKLHHFSAARDFCPLYRSMNPSGHVFSGHPVQKSQLDRYFVPDINNVKPATLLAATSEDQLDSRPRPCLQSTRQEGHVKLFGQILSNPPPVQKSKPSPLCSHQPNISDVPQRSYRFWDGSRIRTGFSSLPESALVYPGSFTGVPIGIPSATSSAHDFQRAYAQTLSANGRRLLEMQRSGLQQRGRTAVARLGANVAGGANVSDPVAAMLDATRRARLLNGEIEKLYNR